MKQLRVIDSHTGGEPTRLVIEGGPDLGTGPISERLEILRTKYDRLRSAVVNEPRGSDVLVGGLLQKPSDPASAAAVIFFNNVGYLGMCGHGTIGLCATLAHLNQLASGPRQIETAVGNIQATWHGHAVASFTNVPSYRKSKNITIEVPTLGKITGDVAWGGNWFFLVDWQGKDLTLNNVEELTSITWRIRQAINAQSHPEVDHIELFTHTEGADSRNFVLCPGKAYDRSPCGTGTSAKLACLAADNALAEDQPWIQQSILGSTFEGSFKWLDRDKGIIQPTIKGSAFVTADATLLFDEQDPFRHGIR